MKSGYSFIESILEKSARTIFFFSHLTKVDEIGAVMNIIKKNIYEQYQALFYKDRFF